MSKHLARDLDRLHRAVIHLATAAEEAVAAAVRSLRDRDPDLARRVIVGDTAIDRFENCVNEECLKLLALHQPVAGDLRRVTAVQAIATDLERIGDLAADIADRALCLSRPPYIPVPARLETMAELATNLVRQSLDSFVHLDARLARRVIRMDDGVDRLNAEIIAEVVRVMKTSPEFIEPGLSLFSATRHLERIADHATNVAEDVVYLVEGEVVRHCPVYGEPGER